MNKSIDRGSLAWRVHGQHPLFNTDEDLLGTRAGRRIGAAASAFRGIRVFCLVFILCVYPCHHQITIHPTAEDRKRLRFTYRLLWSTNQKKRKKRKKKRKKRVENKNSETRKKKKKGKKKDERNEKMKEIEKKKVCTRRKYPRDSIFGILDRLLWIKFPAWSFFSFLHVQLSGIALLFEQNKNCFTIER